MAQHRLTDKLPITTLIRRLTARDPSHRLSAAAALAQMGAQAKGAVSALALALQDGDTNVRKMAALALGDIGPDARSAVPALVDRVLHDDRAAVRRRCAVALGELDAAEALPALRVAGKKDTDEGVRQVALAAVAEIERMAVQAKAA
jgi:HEAT repeat protein